MAQVDPQRSANGFTLRMGGGYQVEVNLKTLEANVPGMKDSVPFAFHRRIHDERTDELIKVPSQQKADHNFISSKPIYRALPWVVTTQYLLKEKILNK